MSEPLEIRTLGGLRIQHGGQAVTGRAAALLAYLACTRRAQAREILATFLWPESPQALSNLRTLLTSLRREVGSYVDTGDPVAMNPERAWWLDVAEFEHQLDTAPQGDVRALEAALELYQGDFLAGLYVDSQSFEDWARLERERLRLRAMESLDTLITCHLAQGEYTRGLARATQLLAMDSLREKTHRQLMELLAQSGEREAALAQYETCCRLLDEELGAGPSPDLVALYRQIQAGGAVQPVERPVVALPGVAPTNPYKGLRPFQERDAQDFFGREALVERLLARLREDGPQARFLAVVGPSGCGKSSVVRAGLLPALRHGAVPGSERWQVLTILPGTHPLDELCIALRRLVSSPNSGLLSELEHDTRGLLRAVKQVLPDDPQVELFLLIDQFEEVFSLVADEGARRHILDSLLTALSEPHSRLRTVVTLRADFYDRPLLYPDLGELVRQRTEVVLPLTPEELERAITGPVERVGVAVEPALIGAMVADVNEQPGALPLLQYALTELFERRANRTLTLVGYRAAGGVRGALAARADALYAALDPAEQQEARQVFLRLVQLGEGSEDTRRRVPWVEAVAVAGSEAAAHMLADRFVRHRLLTLDHDPVTGGRTVELAHEALIREWHLFHGWIDESRADVRQQRLLAASAAEWRAAEQDRSYLLSGTRLAQFEDWAARTDLTLTSDERAFLETSIVEDKRRQARRRRLRNVTLAAALTIALLMTVLSLIAFDQRTTARRQRDRAEREAVVNHSLVLANDAQDAYESGGTDLALALALEATRIEQPPAKAIRTLSTVALGIGTRAILRAQGNEVKAVVFSPDGKLSLSGSCATLVQGTCTEGELIVWEVASASELRRLEGHTDWVTSLAFDPTTPQHALSASGDGLLILWNVESGEIIRRFEGHSGGVNGVVFSPDGKTALSGSDDRTALLWDIATGRIVGRFEGPTDRVTCVAFSPDGQIAAAGSADGTILLWNVTTGEVIHRLMGHTARIILLSFRIDTEGQLLLISDGYDLSYREWNVDTGEQVRFEQVISWVSGLTFSPDGRTALECASNVCNVVNAATWVRTDRILPPSRQDLVSSSTMSADGRLALVGYDTGQLILANMPVSAEVRRFQAEGGLSTVDVSPDGRYLLTGSLSRGTVILWDLQTGQEVRRLEGQQPFIAFARFSPDGQQVLIGSGDWHGGTASNNVVLWNVQTSQIIHELRGYKFYPRGVAFSPDGRTALIGSVQYGGAWEEETGGELIWWDLATGQEIRRFEPVPPIYNVSISSDGRQAVTASGSFDDTMLWDLETGQTVHRWPKNYYGALAAVFAPDPRYFLIGPEGLIALADAQTGEILRRFMGIGATFSIDVSPDEKYVLVGDWYGLLILWNFGTGEEVQRLTQLGGAYNVVFSPDGQTAFSSSVDPQGDVIQWRIAEWSLDELRAWIDDNRYVRDLTCDERAQYAVEPVCE
jgi:WD40 repeat protein/DNA-binding SARP family transcriptional activator